MTRIDEKLLRPVRGMRDYLPEEYYPLLNICEKLAKLAESYGYLRVETPALEHFEILKAKAGEEIINEIYYFKDKAGREVGLRFDLTVPIARIVSYRLDLSKPIRWYYISKVWRYDEPQHGRFREFHQFGIELIGSKTVRADVEVLALAIESMRTLNLNNTIFKVNSRELMDRLLTRYSISDDLKIRVYRVLDKKDKVSRNELASMLINLGIDDKVSNELLEVANTQIPIIKASDLVREFNLGEDLEKYFEKFTELLELQELASNVYLDLGVVRGLDYYTGMVFEVYASNYKLAIGGGGRYDNLIEIYSGIHTPASGFALGIERILEVLNMMNLTASSELKIDYYIYCINEELLSIAYRIARKYRRQGYKVIVDTGDKSLRTALEYASKVRTKYFIIIGSKEVSRGIIKVRDMEKWEEFEEKLVLD